MADTGGGPDFITVDGGEGRTGAAPLAFADHVALPFKLSFARVYSTFARAGLAEHRCSSARGGSAFPIRRCSPLGWGVISSTVGREAMLAIGCIQAQRCHTGRCPTGVAAQSRWLMHGLDPDLKPSRAANYLVTPRAEILALARSCGVAHPALVTPEHFEVVCERYGSASSQTCSTTRQTGLYARPPHARRSKDVQPER
jgi:glutamate synthase domain-containing protein 2